MLLPLSDWTAHQLQLAEPCAREAAAIQELLALKTWQVLISWPLNQDAAQNPTTICQQVVGTAFHSPIKRRHSMSPATPADDDQSAKSADSRSALSNTSIVSTCDCKSTCSLCHQDNVSSAGGSAFSDPATPDVLRCMHSSGHHVSGHQAATAYCAKDAVAALQPVLHQEIWRWTLGAPQECVWNYSWLEAKFDLLQLEAGVTGTAHVLANILIRYL